MRATVFVADATPELAGGTAPITASVAGAITQPSASASPKNQSTSSMALVSGLQSVDQRRAGSASRAETGRRRREDVPRRAAALLDEPAPSIRPSAIGLMTSASLDRAVAVRELEVLGQSEGRPEQREERDADGPGADAELRAAEEAEVQHRLVDVLLPPEERADEPEREGEGGQHDGRSASRRPEPR